MNLTTKLSFCATVCASALFFALAGCKAKANSAQPAAKDAPFMSAVTTAPPPAAQNPADEAPAPEKTGGFDGMRAYAQVAKQVSFGPRPAGSPALFRAITISLSAAPKLTRSRQLNYLRGVSTWLLCSPTPCRSGKASL